jgi:hypothetical protein
MCGLLSPYKLKWIVETIYKIPKHPNRKKYRKWYHKKSGRAKMNVFLIRAVELTEARPELAAADRTAPQGA